jgi:hypothetical protein
LAYSNPLFAEFTRNSVFADPIVVSPVPPLLTGSVFTTVAEVSETALDANFSPVTAAAFISAVGTDRGEIFADVTAPLTNAGEVKFLSVW